MVASSIPLAVGSAIAFAMQGTKRVAVTFFGDGATEEGTFYEALNIAALRKAPVIFVCENNLYSSHMHIRDRRPADNIPEIVRPFGMPAIRIDGNDVFEVYRTAQEAVQNARLGRGPTFIECRTYRWRGHVGPNYDLERGLRSKEELEKWMSRCPIRLLETRLKNKSVLTEAEAARLRRKVADEVDRAVAWARESPLPDESELTEHVFKPK
jgi:pyruvate dehydrogenase E1 component alpha subunit